MNIEIKQICDNCGQSMNELNLIVETNMNIIWSDKISRYIIQSGSFDFQQLDYFFCPQCNTESNATKQTKDIANRNNMDSIDVSEINTDHYIIQFLRTAFNEILVVFKRRSKK